MQKLIKFIKSNLVILLVLVLSVFSFYKMLKPGIYSMQDFHLFRLYEFDKCIQRSEIPCRWATDAGMGYGEPIFNFYGQLPYALGEVLHLSGLSFIDSIKFLFILSLVGSALSMFFLAKKIWKNDLAAVLSSVLYLYAPYRAVNVWVRGALPEALAFALFPLIILAIENKSVFGFALLMATLILTHNLSVILFLPVILGWIIHRKFWKSIWGGILAVGISSFYILPVLFENKFVTLWTTAVGYFDFHGHFVEISQLLISRYWGYGASLFGLDDRLSLSVGHLQWIIPLGIVIYLVIKRVKVNKDFLVFFILGLFFLFMTHNKSTLIWDTIVPMRYIQFPWRFLGPAVFCFALSSGYLIDLTKKKLLVSVIIILAALTLNVGYFKDDVWYKVDDSYFLTGEEWNRQRQASLKDFWPDFGHKFPEKFATGEYINYFPGWMGAEPDSNGLIPSKGTTFVDTPIRKVGNTVSLGSILLFGLLTFGVSIKKIIWRKKS